METIKRQKITEREQLSYEEKVELLKKSDCKCCHCGKSIFVNYGATVEHFVPLSKGGTNRNINLVALCDDCNQEKNNFIYRPEDYLEYLKPEYLDKLKGYFDSYIKSFDFVNRDNLLACDRYKVFVSTVNEKVYDQIMLRKKNKTARNKARDTMYKCSIPMWVKRATYDDVDKLTEYFIKYLKKYNCLDDEYAARINIQFWLTFGCIYYIERDGEIKAFITVSVTKANNCVFLDEQAISHFLTINIFTYYSNSYALTLAWNLSRKIPQYLAIEQDLDQIPVKFCVLKNDGLSDELCKDGSIYESDRFRSSFMVLYSGYKDDLVPLVEDEKLSNFFHKFGQVNRKRMDTWFTVHGTETYDWMIQELELTEPDDKK